MKILSRPNGNAAEYGRWSVNPYLGCDGRCAYCYLKKGPWQNGMGGDGPVLKKGVTGDTHAYHLAMAEILENSGEIIRDGGLFMTFTSDPCAPETRDLFLRILHDCVLYGINVTLLTKRADFCPLEDVVSDTETAMRLIPWSSQVGILASDLWRRRMAFGFTLTGHDELEPGASTSAERLVAMQRLHGQRYHTWASIEPVIGFGESLAMIRQALTAGCEHFKIGLLTSRTRVVRKDFWLDGCRFPAYDIEECLWFIDEVMALTEGLATVYWKRSFEDFLQGTDRNNPQPVRGMTAREYLSQWDHSVGSDWDIFKDKEI